MKQAANVVVSEVLELHALSHVWDTVVRYYFLCTQLVFIAYCLSHCSYLNEQARPPLNALIARHIVRHATAIELKAT